MKTERPHAMWVTLTLVAAGIATEAIADDLLIREVTVISAHETAAQGPSDVLIRDGRIARIGDDLEAGGATVIEGGGRFLTPGLMDAHHHVSFAPGLGALGYGVSRELPELSALYIRQQPRSLLYHGVTQIVDPSPLDSWPAFESTELRPDLFRCGEIPNPGGYPMNQMPWERIEDAFAYRLDDESPESVVRRIAADGGICVKLYIEDGFGDSTSWPLLDDETVGRIRKTAHELDLLLYAHANAIDMHRVALRNRVDVIGHGLWNWQWPDDPENPPVTETLDRLRSSRTGFVPTHRVMAGIAGELRSSTLENPAFVDVVPTKLLDWYRSDQTRPFTEELIADFPPGMGRDEIAGILESGHRRAQRSTAYLAEKDYPLLLGSDCPGSLTIANQPGLCTLQEMRSMAEAGVSLPQILAAATINNAERFGLADDYGTVEVGKIANLLLLSADPLEDVEAWNRIDTIILHGRAHDRASFSARRDD